MMIMTMKVLVLLVMGNGYDYGGTCPKQYDVMVMMMVMMMTVMALRMMVATWSLLMMLLLMLIA